jgi:homoserine O-succinyltransferase
MEAHLESTWIAKTPQWQRRSRSGSGPLEVAIVNNMPDSALIATERQFTGLLETAAAGPIRISLYHLPEIARGPEARAVIEARYRPVEELYRRPADALIVTGNEPHARNLADETYWGALSRLADWARDHTTSAIWSCLAAHAAVLHLDGIERQPLAAKRSGVFSSYPRGDTGLPGRLHICHSRLNEVTGPALIAKGYEILCENTGGQVCIFAKNYRSRFVFFQGHPEYEPDSLAKEYRRDVGRYLRADREIYPELPENYFDAATARRMNFFRAQAEAVRDPALMGHFPQLGLRDGLSRRLESSANAIFTNWLAHVASCKMAA